MKIGLTERLLRDNLNVGLPKHKPFQSHTCREFIWKLQKCKGWVYLHFFPFCRYRFVKPKNILIGWNATYIEINSVTMRNGKRESFSSQAS